LLLACFLGTPLAVQNQSGASPEAPDLLAAVRRDTALSKSIGLPKLSTEEQTALASLLKTAYVMGWEASLKSMEAGSTNPENKVKQVEGRAIFSKIDEADDSILKLRNGMVVELTSLAPAFIGFGKDCIVFRSGAGLKIWIEGKKTYRCDVLKAVDEKLLRVRGVREDSIFECRGNGSVLKLLGSGLYEVDSFSTITTSLWLPGSSVLVIDDVEIVNLDDGDEAVGVTRIR